MVKKQEVQFLTINPNHLKRLRGDGESAIVLAFLLHTLEEIRSAPDQQAHHNLWFECPFRRIFETTYMQEWRICDCLDKLERVGFIKQDKPLEGTITLVKVEAEALKEGGK